MTRPTAGLIFPAGASGGGSAGLVFPARYAGSITGGIPPTITSFTPTSGQLGTLVTITGTGFTGATGVVIGASTNLTGVTVVSSTQITATVSTGSTGTFTILHPNGGVTSATSFTVVPPTITSFTPTTGPAGTVITITGTGFTGVTGVRIGASTNLTGVTVVSPTQITATLPVGAATGTITVLSPAGNVTSGTNFVMILPPTITSFAPASGPPGTVVTITGTNFIGATGARIGPTGNMTAFTVVSNTQITATIPAGAGTARLNVLSPAGDTQSTTNFTVPPPPTITSFTPTSGPVGTQVTITGTGFTGATGARIGATALFDFFTVLSDTQVRGQIPTGAGAATGTLTVLHPNGNVTSAGTFTVPQLPTITSFTPASGGPGTVITINGTNLNLVTDADVDAQVSLTSLNIISSTQMTATVDPAATSAVTGKITLYTETDFVTSATNFSVTSTGATITSFSPASGAPGVEVTINGTKLDVVTAVQIGSINVPSYSIFNVNRIKARIPATAATGKFTVVHPQGNGVSATDFTVLPPIAVSGFSPSSGPPGTAVTITGNSFTGATGATIGTRALTSFTVVSDTQITGVIPANATSGVITVSLTTASAASAASFTVPPPPTITSFTPTSGPENTAITITGTNFIGATGGRIGASTALADFTVVSATQITATIPPGAFTGTLTILHPNGNVTSGTNFSLPVPTITSFTPTSGQLGTVVTITGTGFTGATGARIGASTSLTGIAVNSPTQITATVSTGSTGTLTILHPNGNVTSGTSFTVSPPTITSFTPISGPVGTQVTITGTGFTGVTGARIGASTSLTGVTVVSSTQITATIPSGAVAGTLTVLSPAGNVTSVDTFSIPPTLTSYSPANGLPGAVVTITGTNLTGATGIRIGASTDLTSFSVLSATQVRGTIPAGAATGTLTILHPLGNVTSVSSFVILQTPTITSFSPTSGGANTVVTITGTNMTGATGIRLGASTNLTSFSVLSATQVRGTIPSGSITGALTILHPAGNVTSVSNFSVNPPTITSFTPSSGTPGTTVTITGSRFTGATGVRIGSVNLANVTVVSNTQITAVIPTNASTGTLTVLHPNGNVTSATSFTANPVVIDSFTPTSGSAGTVVTVSGSGFTGANKAYVYPVLATGFSVLSDTQITLTVPSGLSPGPTSIVIGYPGTNIEEYSFDDFEVI